MYKDLNKVLELPFLDLFQCDCMELLRATPDGFYDIACIDVPYGINEDGASNHSRRKLTNPTLYTPKNWDKEPPAVEYFNELFRVSKNQIIWGANHFISKLPFDSSCWIVWDKENGENDFADCELAWTSFKTSVRRFKFRWAGMLQGDMKNKQQRIHPTEKPIQLYSWLLRNYTQPNQRILDTHAGSLSIALAVYKANLYENMNLHLTASELDLDYCNSAIKRIKNGISQTNIFQ